MSLTSPLKKTPPCWEDDKRMTALYSPFRMRETNPVDYDSKLKFWQNSILQWCMEKNNCIFSIKIIQDEFKRRERVPLGLSTVVENLERDGLVKLKEDFEKIDPSESWSAWIIKSFVKSPVTWTFQKLRMALLESDERLVEYVCLDFLKNKSDELLSKISGRHKVFEASELRGLLTSDSVEMSKESFDFLLKWMALNQQIFIHKLDDEILIKINDHKDSAINEREISLYVIERNKVTFEKAIQALEEEKDDLILSAKSYLRKGMRETAKSYLRRKKEIEKTISKRVSALENIEVMLSRIYDSTTDSKVLDTYKIAVDALKNSFKENGLSEDEVIKTVTEMEEINEMHDEVQNALAAPISSACDSDLEKELMVIMEAEKAKRNRPRVTQDILPGELVLPDVPSTSPEKMKKRSVLSS